VSDELITYVGNVCKEDPVLKFSPQGHAICEFSIRVPGKKAKGSQPAVEAFFVNIVAWRDLGEHVAESVRKDDRVIVQGIVKHDSWDKPDGTKGHSSKLNAWNVGLELSFTTAEAVRVERTNTPQAAAGGGYVPF
jgi:single-strand DNA-binding protein